MTLKTLIAFLAVVTAIVVLELVALSKGFDGMILKTTLAILGGMGGYTITKLTRSKKGESEK